jgi:hypothetical protein
LNGSLIAEIADRVRVAVVALICVRDERTVVADVAERVGIFVALQRVGSGGAVVLAVGHPVLIDVGGDGRVGARDQLGAGKVERLVAAGQP